MLPKVLVYLKETDKTSPPTRTVIVYFCTILGGERKKNVFIGTFRVVFNKPNHLVSFRRNPKKHKRHCEIKNKRHCEQLFLPLRQQREAQRNTELNILIKVYQKTRCVSKTRRVSPCFITYPKSGNSLYIFNR